MLVKLTLRYAADPCFVWFGPGVVFHRDQRDMGAIGSLIYHLGGAMGLDDGDNFVTVRETPEEIEKLIQNSPGGTE